MAMLSRTIWYSIVMTVLAWLIMLRESWRCVQPTHAKTASRIAMARMGAPVAESTPERRFVRASRTIRKVRGKP